MELDHYTFVLLRRGSRADSFTEDELEHLQAAHLAHLAGMRERGAMLAAGPFSEQPDESLRGFCLYGTGSTRRGRSSMEIRRSSRAVSRRT